MQDELEFENDVKMYGTQAMTKKAPKLSPFENDVKMYGIQARTWTITLADGFENDVKMYGTQAIHIVHIAQLLV